MREKLTKQDCGNSTKITRNYYDSLLLEMRMIDSVEASTQMQLYGESFSTPVMVAALSGLDMSAIAKGAAAAGAVMWAGIGDEEELRQIIDTGAKTVKIIKPYANKDLIYKKMEQAEKLGAFAVGMDIDYAFGGKNTRGYAMSFPVSPITLDEIKSYVKATKLPFILKGVLSEQDTKKSMEAGVAGIVVSHHKGAVMDYAIPPLKILPRITKIIDKKIPIFVDCSIVSGMDAFKALALGANAVGVGKALMERLSLEGADGVQKLLEGITEDLRRVMSLTGSFDINHIDPEILWY